MSKHKNKILMAVLIVISLYIIISSNNSFFFSVNTLELENKGVPYIRHNSRITSTPLGDVNIKSEPLLFTCKSEIATLSTEKRELFSGGKKIDQTVYVPSWKGAISVPDPRAECWKTSLEFDGNTYYYIQGQKHTLNRYVNTTFDGDGSFVTFDLEQISTTPRDEQGKITGPTVREWVTYYGVFKNWEDERRIFWFEIDNSFLELRWKNGSNILKLGSANNPTLIIKNDLVNNMKGELLIKLHKTKTKEERIMTLPLVLSKDENEYQINLPKETLGGLITEVKLSVDFLGVKIPSKYTLKRTFNIIPNIGNQTTSDSESLAEDKIELTANGVSLSPKNVDQPISKSIILIIFLVVILGLLFKLAKRNDIQQ